MKDKLIERINSLDMTVPLGEIFEATYGAEIGGKKDSYPHFVFEELGDGDFIPLIDLNQFDRYCPIHYSQFIKYDKTKEREITKKYPKQNIALRARKIWQQERIILRQSSKDLCASFEVNESISFLKAFHIYANESKSSYSLKYLLGILNSDIMNQYTKLAGINMTEGGKQPQIRIARLREIPIRKINFADQIELKIYEDIIANVEKILEIKQRLQMSVSESDKVSLQRIFNKVDGTINGLVDILYS